MKLMQAAEQADESEDERVNRLRENADAVGADPTTLFDVEEDARGLVRLLTERNSETVEDLQLGATAVAPMLGLNPEDAEEVVDPEVAAALVGQMLTSDPEKLALLVYSLHEILRRNGLYDELGTEPPAPGELWEPIDVGGGR